MRRLIFIRHAETNRVPGVNAHQWGLTDAGRERCLTLADRMRGYDLVGVVSSPEPKAIQTAQPIAEALRLPLLTADGLREHDRRHVPYVGDNANFQDTIRRLFAEPGALVYGSETADQAHTRFAEAVQAITVTTPAGNLAIVTHATVLTLYVSRLAGGDPFDMWLRWGMPAYVVLSWPDRAVIETVEHV
jgi:broad specificity phosphatase PhoE